MLFLAGCSKDVLLVFPAYFEFEATVSNICKYEFEFVYVVERVLAMR